MTTLSIQFILIKVLLTFGLLFTSFSGFCQHEVKNEELAYLLNDFQKENYDYHLSGDGHYFLKIVRVESKSSYTLGKKGEAEYPPLHFYYLLTSTFDEASYTEARLFRTEDMIDPKMEGVEEVTETRMWKVHITYIQGKGKDKIVGKPEQQDRKQLTLEIRMPG